VKGLTHFFTVNNGLTGGCFLLHQFYGTFFFPREGDSWKPWEGGGCVQLHGTTKQRSNKYRQIACSLIFPRLSGTSHLF